MIFSDHFETAPCRFLIHDHKSSLNMLFFLKADQSCSCLKQDCMVRSAGIALRV